jgi:hypothetical protein
MKSSTDFSMKILSNTVETLYKFKELTFHWEVTYFLKLFLTKYGNVTPEFSKNLTWKQIIQLLIQRKQIEFVVFSIVFNSKFREEEWWRMMRH